MQLVQQLLGLALSLQLGVLRLKITYSSPQTGDLLDEVTVCNVGEMSQQGPGHVATFHGLTTFHRRQLGRDHAASTQWAPVGI